jgi:hypothetical protein
MKKTCLFSGLLITLLTIAQIVHAIDRESMLLFSMSGNSTARIGAINTGNSNLSLVLLNQQGDMLFSESIKKNANYFKFYDLSQLEDGMYALKLSGKEIDQVREFVVRGSNITIIKNVPEIKPTFIEQGKDYLFIVYKNPDQQKVSVSFNKNGKAVFKDSGSSAMEFKKKYTLKDLDSGEYTVELNSSSKVYTYKLAIP